MPKIPYGMSHFESIRREHYVYVDKTRFIKELEYYKHLIYLRPRRFGKSLFLSMLDCYYDVAAKDQFDELFRGLYIHEHPTENQNNYYILRFNFSGVETTDNVDVVKSFFGRVEDGAKSFIARYGLDIELNLESSSAQLLSSLFTGFSALRLQHKIYIMIDEYDHFTNSMLRGDASDFLIVLQKGGFVRSFYEVIKEKAELGIVARFFATGVMSVSLDSMSSGFNIVTNITSNARFADAMGFTSDEVKDILRKVLPLESEQSEVYEILRENYNGYLFSLKKDVRIFNSTLIMYYLAYYMQEKESPESLIDPNLNQSGVTIKNIVDLKNSEENYQMIQDIVESKEVAGTLQHFIDIEKKFDRNDVITLLFNIGLLTIKQPGIRTKFEIPNKVIERIYLQYLGELIQRKANYKIDIEKQGTALDELGEKGSVEGLTRIVEEFLTNISGRNMIQFDEKYIKLIYMTLISSTNQFIIYDEFPVGRGFADLFIQKAPSSYAKYEALIELKYIKKSDTTKARIESELLKGVNQVEGYLQDERIGGKPDLKKFVIVFSGFEAVRLMEL